MKVVKFIKKNPKDIPRFGLAIGLLSALFKVTRFILTYYLPIKNEGLKAFISGLVCSLSLSKLTTASE